MEGRVGLDWGRSLVGGRRVRALWSKAVDSFGAFQVVGSA